MKKKLTLIGILALMINLKPALAQKNFELDFCQLQGGKTFYDALSTIHLKKGEFFTVTIKNINPYRYNILVTTKHDTLKPGKAPALLSEFMEPSSLGNLVAGLATSLNGKEAEKAASNDKEKSKSKSGYESFKINDTENAQKKKEKLIQEARRKQNAVTLLKTIEANYNSIQQCYTGSIKNSINSQADCHQNLDQTYYTMVSKECLINLENQIQLINQFKSDLLSLIDTLLQDKTKDTVLYRNMIKTLAEKKYSSFYLHNIATKIYSNFLIADQTELLSTYTSFPIQVQGDLLELKIDITPKDTDPKKEETKKTDATGNSISSTNTLTNQSPVNIHIHTGKDSSDKEKATVSDSEDILSKEELKINMPAATRNIHLSYKFRTSNCFYGFSGGFFMDWLKDDQYAFRPDDPSNSATTYTILKESSSNSNKYGIMASVNVGSYFSLKTDWFVHLFAGPGLSVESTPQPRLLFGLGIGKGGPNKFALNAGMALGQVKKLSNAIDLSRSYPSAPTELYTTRNDLQPFISISYVFDFVKDK